MTDHSQHNDFSGPAIRAGISKSGVDFIQKLVDMREEFMNNIDFGGLNALERALKDADLDLTDVSEKLGIQPMVAAAKHRANGGMYKDGMWPRGTPARDQGMSPN